MSEMSHRCILTVAQRAAANAARAAIAAPAAPGSYEDGFTRWQPEDTSAAHGPFLGPFLPDPGFRPTPCIYRGVYTDLAGCLRDVGRRDDGSIFALVETGGVTISVPLVRVDFPDWLTG